MSSLRLSEFTTTNQSPRRKPLMVQEDNDEDYGNIKWMFMRDIGPAWSWVLSHRELFCGEVTEPAFLLMDSVDQQKVFKDYLRNEMDEARDAFLFVFECPEDLHIFMSHCYEEQGLKVHN